MSHAFGQDHEAFLQAPAEQDLCWRPVVFRGERLEQRIVSTCGADKRRVSLEDNAVLVAPVDNVRTSEPWMKFYLVHTQDASVLGRLLLGEVSEFPRKLAI